MSTILHATMLTLGALIGLAIVCAALILIVGVIVRRRIKLELDVVEARRKRFDERWKKLEVDIRAGARAPTARRFNLKPKDPRP